MDMTVFFELIKSIGDIAIMSLFFSCYLPTRPISYWRAHKSRLLVGLGGICLAYVIRNLLPEMLSFGEGYMLLNVVTYVGLMLALAVPFFLGKFEMKCLLIGISMMIVFLFEFFLYGLIKLLFQVNYFESTNAIFQYGGIFASQFLQFAAIFLLKKFRGNKRAFQGEKRFYLLQTTVPLLSALFFVLYPVFDGERSPEDDLRYFIIVLLFAAINCIHYVVFEFYQQAERKNYEQQLLNQVYVHREEYYCRMEQHQKEIRKIRHDLKNQLLAIRADNPEIKNQVNVLLRDIQEQEETLFTKHQGLNLLLNNKYQRAKESSIQCSFEVKVPETIQFEAKDLGSLIGNAIDNAIEACQYCKENRYIALQLIYFNHMLVMTIENSFDGVVRELTTRKQIAYEHGFGTDSMRSVTQKYNGDMSYEFLENCFRLEVSIGEKQSSL